MKPLSDDSQRTNALALWATLHSDADAPFDVEHNFDATEVAPYVTWGTSPDQAIAFTGTVPTHRPAPRKPIAPQLNR
jgi:3-isopropylmalate/(R)-2-methylmalate dehydratase large subunit